MNDRAHRPKASLIWVEKEAHKSLGYELEELLEHEQFRTVHYIPPRSPLAKWGAIGDPGTIASLISVYLFAPYLRAILTEAGKDHYGYLKQRLSRFFSEKPKEKNVDSLPEVEFEILIGSNFYVKFKFPWGDINTDEKIQSMFLIMEKFMDNESEAIKELEPFSQEYSSKGYGSEVWVIYEYDLELNDWVPRKNEKL